MKILIAEDEPVSLKTLERIVLEHGQVVSTRNGEQAYQAFAESLMNNDPFNLIFLDIMMPEFNGQEALKAIRDYEEEKQIAEEDRVKIIIVSSHSDGENIYNAHLSGCNNYLLKPISKEKINKIFSDFSNI